MSPYEPELAHARIRAYEAVKDREAFLNVEQTRERVEWLLTGEVPSE